MYIFLLLWNMIIPSSPKVLHPLLSRFLEKIYNPSINKIKITAATLDYSHHRIPFHPLPFSPFEPTNLFSPHLIQTQTQTRKTPPLASPLFPTLPSNPYYPPFSLLYFPFLFFSFVLPFLTFFSFSSLIPLPLYFSILLSLLLPQFCPLSLSLLFSFLTLTYVRTCST